MSNANFLEVDSYSVTIASTATPQSILAPSGTVWPFARDVLIRCPSGNTSDILVGNRTRQLYTIPKGTDIRLSTIMNRMSQSGKYTLGEIFIKVGTNSDKAEILLIEPSND